MSWLPRARTMCLTVLLALASAAALATAPTDAVSASTPSPPTEPHATASGPGCGTPERCFARMTEAQKDVSSIRARFQQIKHVAMLTEPLVSGGRFVYRRPASVRWEMETPEAMVVEIEGDELRAGAPGSVSNVDAGQATTLFRDLAMLFTGAGDYTGDRFTLGPGTLGADSFVLTPRDPSIGRVIAAIEIALDPQTGGPRQVVIREANGDRTEITLSDVEVERARGGPAS
ncbi:MAG TPA: outer membrane lipoprotein carrier protein LolA [Candidatus Binatia bacterium]